MMIIRLSPIIFAVRLLPPAPNTSPLYGEDEGAIPQNERAEMVEARELFQVTKHHFNTAPLCGAGALFIQSSF